MRPQGSLRLCCITAALLLGGSAVMWAQTGGDTATGDKKAAKLAARMNRSGEGTPPAKENVPYGDHEKQLFRKRVYPYNIPGEMEGGAGEKKDPSKAHELSTIYHVTKDDPPIFMTYGIPLQPLPLPKNTPRGQLIHNPAFGLLFKEKLDEAGIENHFYHGGNKPPENAERDFILKHFFPN